MRHLLSEFRGAWVQAKFNFLLRGRFVGGRASLSRWGFLPRWNGACEAFVWENATHAAGNRIRQSSKQSQYGPCAVLALPWDTELITQELQLPPSGFLWFLSGAQVWGCTSEKVGRAAGEVAQQRSMRDTHGSGASASLAGRRFPEATPAWVHRAVRDCLHLISQAGWNRCNLVSCLACSPSRALGPHALDAGVGVSRVRTHTHPGADSTLRPARLGPAHAATCMSCLCPGLQ